MLLVVYQETKLVILLCTILVSVMICITENPLSIHEYDPFEEIRFQVIRKRACIQITNSSKTFVSGTIKFMC